MKEIDEIKRLLSKLEDRINELQPPQHECDNIRCSCSIKVGCYVRYNQHAKQDIPSVIKCGNPSARVTKIESREDGAPLVYWGGTCSDIGWLEHA